MESRGFTVKPPATSVLRGPGAESAGRPGLCGGGFYAWANGKWSLTWCPALKTQRPRPRRPSVLDRIRHIAPPLLGKRWCHMTTFRSLPTPTMWLRPCSPAAMRSPRAAEQPDVGRFACAGNTSSASTRWHRNALRLRAAEHASPSTLQRILAKARAAVSFVTYGCFFQTARARRQ